LITGLCPAAADAAVGCNIPDTIVIAVIAAQVAATHRARRRETERLAEVMNENAL
jgi:hypothetical protein